jgi:hypothetical protein
MFAQARRCCARREEGSFSYIGFGSLRFYEFLIGNIHVYITVDGAGVIRAAGGFPQLICG